MRQVSLVGTALLLLASSASAQTVLKINTFKEGCGKVTTIEAVAPACPPNRVQTGTLTLDQLAQSGPGGAGRRETLTLDQLARLSPAEREAYTHCPPQGPACPPPCPPRCPPVCVPVSPLFCLLPDQPALLYRLALMNALQTNAITSGALGNPGLMPRNDGMLPSLDELTRPGAVRRGNGEMLPRLDDLAQPIAFQEKKLDEKRVDEKEADRPLPVRMQTLDATDWVDGRSFTDPRGRHWTLVKGCALQERVAHMRGWLVESDARRIYFVHETGNIYSYNNPVAPLP